MLKKEITIRHVLCCNTTFNTQLNYNPNVDAEKTLFSTDNIAIFKVYWFFGIAYVENVMILMKNEHNYAAEA